MDHHEYQYTVSTVDELMKVNNKEHQTLGMKELKYLVDKYPNDSQLGAEIRKLYWKTRHATDNNPKGTSDYEPENEDETKRFPGNHTPHWRTGV